MTFSLMKDVQEDPPDRIRRPAEEHPRNDKIVPTWVPIWYIPDDSDDYICRN